MAANLLISEFAERTGFTASALRYYEQMGLLTADSRTPAGYRLYDEKAAAKLRFIARAKHLGLPLEEIRDLVAIWDGGLCAHVQDRLRTHVAAKSQEVQARIEELSGFADELAAAQVELSGPAPEGGCGDDCGCTAQGSVSSARRLLTLTTTRHRGNAEARVAQVVSASHSVAPVACTLGAADQPARMAEWRDILAAVTRRDPVAGGVSLSFPFDPDLASHVADLALREQSCCAFFDFTLRIGAGSLVLDVRAPDAGADVIAELFGASA